MFPYRRSRFGRDPAFTFDRFRAAFSGYGPVENLSRIGKLRLFALLAETAKEHSAIINSRRSIPVAQVQTELDRLARLLGKVAEAGSALSKCEGDISPHVRIALRRAMMLREGYDPDAHDPLPGDPALIALDRFFQQAQAMREVAGSAAVATDEIAPPKGPTKREWLRAHRLPDIYRRVFRVECRNGLVYDDTAGPGNEFVRRATALIEGNAGPDPRAVKQTRTRARQKLSLS